MNNEQYISDEGKAKQIQKQLPMTAILRHLLKPDERQFMFIMFSDITQSKLTYTKTVESMYVGHYYKTCKIGETVDNSTNPDRYFWERTIHIDLEKQNENYHKRMENNKLDTLEQILAEGEIDGKYYQSVRYADKHGALAYDNKNNDAVYKGVIDMYCYYKEHDSDNVDNYYWTKI